ncbi:TipAS antibiotic-recognition domain-containing protein [Microbispora sp. GKU 823]|uniref:TipAS antibiotic-recognition domain-containing protein n=1 Tax=Microbispora sp. GKU 823 TaxID=1652100 RepID=UPI0009A3BF54|nr:TipAS antibiotic-recognition domain-containing protein [Microbispora sp. GKU 823]
MRPQAWSPEGRRAHGLLGRRADTGATASGKRAMDVAERHRAHITRWFYDCTYEIHKGLGEMYVTDPRFAANYERVAEGLSRYVRDAVHANAARHA